MEQTTNEMPVSEPVGIVEITQMIQNHENYGRLEEVLGKGLSGKIELLLRLGKSNPRYVTLKMLEAKENIINLVESKVAQAQNLHEVLILGGLISCITEHDPQVAIEGGAYNNGWTSIESYNDLPDEDDEYVFLSINDKKEITTRFEPSLSKNEHFPIDLYTHWRRVYPKPLY